MLQHVRSGHFGPRRAIDYVIKYVEFQESKDEKVCPLLQLELPLQKLLKPGWIPGRGICVLVHPNKEFCPMNHVC